jgi:hypothetical protein
MKTWPDKVQFDDQLRELKNRLQEGRGGEAPRAPQKARTECSADFPILPEERPRQWGTW